MCGSDLKIAQKSKAEGISTGKAEMLAERVKASIEIGLDEEAICKAFGITMEVLDDFKRRHGWKDDALMPHSTAKNKHSSADHAGLY